MPERMRGWVTYAATSGLLAAAWHVDIKGGLWIVNAAAAIVGIALGRFALGANWRHALGWSRRNAALGLMMGLLLALATQMAGRLLLPLLPIVAAQTQHLYTLLNQSPGAYGATPVILLVVAAEELVYRGVVTSLCSTRHPRWHTLVCSTALYVLPLTSSGSWLLVAIGIALGGFWTATRLSTNSLLVPLLTHGIWSAATFVLWPLM